MRCITCGYTLTDLVGGVCPECGRAFDAADGSTYLTGRVRPWRPWLVWVSFVCASWVAVVNVLVVVLAVLARFQLGHWPRPTKDDSKALVPELWDPLALATVLSPFVLLAGFGRLTIAALRGTPRARTLILVALAVNLTGYFVVSNTRLWAWFWD